MSELIKLIPKIFYQNKHNYSEVARLLHIHRYIVKQLEDDHECHHHIVVRGRLMTVTRRLQDEEMILAKDSNYYDLGGSDAKDKASMQEP